MTREEAITRLHWLKRELIKGTDMNEPIDMAIEALSAESETLSHEEAWKQIEGDLISRADAKQQISEWATIITKPTLLDKDATMVVLDALPSADAVHKPDYSYEADMVKRLRKAKAVQGWIPCSERLPKRDELVLVTYKTTDRIHLCRYLDDGSENPWWSYIDDCCAWNNVVLAWMPLPKPYKGGDSE